MLLHLAWHTAYLTRVDHKHFPTLAKHLKQFAPTKAATTEPAAKTVEPWRVFQDLMRSKAVRKDPGAKAAAKPHSKRKAKT